MCERFEPRSHFKSRLSLIVRVNVVLNKTVVVDIIIYYNNCDNNDNINIINTKSTNMGLSMMQRILQIDGGVSHLGQ